VIIECEQEWLLYLQLKIPGVWTAVPNWSYWQWCML